MSHAISMSERFKRLNNAPCGEPTHASWGEPAFDEMNTTPTITQLEMSSDDIELAERIASKLGYSQTAYTSTSQLWGLYCLHDNPAYSGGYHAFVNRDETKFDSNCRECGGKCRDSVHNLRLNYQIKGCVIKTAELGFLFVVDLEDLQLHDLAEQERQVVA